MTHYDPSGTMTDKKDMVEEDFPMCKYKNLEELPLILTVSDVAEILNISRNGAYNICNCKGFPSIRIGKQIRVPKEPFISWMHTA